jgi:hypothetical protein
MQVVCNANKFARTCLTILSHPYSLALHSPKRSEWEGMRSCGASVWPIGRAVLLAFYMRRSCPRHYI